MLEIQIHAAKPQDFKPRGNVPVDTVVLHTTEGGSIDGAITWWDRDDVVASAHYLIDGKRIVQYVAEGDAAFHAGNWGINARSIGIEVVGHCAAAATWTPEVMAQLVTLVADICRRHHVPVLRQPGPGICGHCDVPDPKHPGLRGGAGHHTDPGPHFPWQAFLDAVRVELTEPYGTPPMPPARLPRGGE